MNQAEKNPLILYCSEWGPFHPREIRILLKNPLNFDLREIMTKEMDFYPRDQALREMKFYSCESAYFDDLIAIKLIWLDKKNYMRKFSNQTKYQMIRVVRVDRKMKS